MKSPSPLHAGLKARFARNGVGVLIFFHTIFSYAQNSQFTFDLSGNFQSQTAEVAALPQIIGQPQMQVVIPDESASFSVVVADTSGVSYQWYFGATAIPGATSDALLLTNVSSANEGVYFVAVSNVLGSIASTAAHLYIDSRGCGMPDSWQLMYFCNLNQNPLGDYDGDGVPNLQEFLDGTNPTNAASALYRITLVNDGGTVTPVPDGVTYTNGQAVTLTATGSASAPFRAWTGDVVTRSSSIILTMTNNKTLFAHFINPITFEWTNTASADWNTPLSWSPNLVPGSNDSVIITLPNVTVTLNSNLDLTDLNLGIAANGVNGPVLDGTGTLTVNGTCNWAAGTMQGGGRTVIAPGAALNIVNANYVYASRTLENAGTAFFAGPGPLFMISGDITNDAGGTFIMGSANSFTGSGGLTRFDNAGTFLTTVSGGTTAFINTGFNNYGTVQIQSGTLDLDGGGTDAGTISVPAGTTLNFAGGIFTSSGNPSITGAGTLMFTGGSSTLGGTVNVTGSNVFSNGSVDFTGNYTCANNTMVISGGIANFDGSGTVSPFVLNLSNGTLGGAQTVTVGGAMSWTGGSMTGTGRTVIPSGATLTVANPAPIFITSRTLDNGGTTLLSEAGTLTMNPGVITNENGALFRIQNPYSLSGGGSPRFDNAGTLNTLGNGLTSFAGVALNNFNTVGILGGTLALSGGGQNAGAITVPAGTTLSIGGAFTSSSNSSITGAGSLIVSFATASLAGTVNVTGSNVFSGNGSVDFTGNYICANNTMIISGAQASFDGTGTVSPSLLNLSSGALGGAQSVTVGSAMSWTGGSMTGTGRTVIPPGATLTISNTVFFGSTGRTLDNAGSVTCSGGIFSMTGGVITNENGGMFQIQNPYSLSFGGGSPRFDNAGIFRKLAGSGTTTIGGVAFNNYGTVDIQSGILAVNGSGVYVSSPNAVLNCALGGTTAGTNYGQLQVAGTVALAGVLSVDLTNHYFPALNDSFTVLTAGVRTGAFANFLYPSNQIAMLLSNTATSVILRVTNILAIPQPFLLQPQIIGSNIDLTWTTVSNTTYRLEFNPNLASSNWNALPDDVTALSNTASKMDLLTPTNRFYRVLVLP